MRKRFTQYKKQKKQYQLYREKNNPKNSPTLFSGDEPQNI